MKKLLIIRSASLQQLDKNIVKLMETFPSEQYEYHMLTHEHSKKLVEKYKAIKRVIVYPYKQSFSAKRTVRELKNESYDVIVIPVTNVTGAGFFNVLQFSLTVRAKRRVVCNLVSDMWDVSSQRIWWMGAKHILMMVTSFMSTMFVSPLILLFLPFLLKQLEKKGN